MAHVQHPVARVCVLFVALCVGTVHGQSSYTNVSRYRTAPPATLRICVLDSSPDLSVISGTLADGTLLSATDASNQLQGLSIDIISALFGQILGWPYTVRYFNPDVTGFSQTMYKARMNIDCDVAVQSFFVTAERDVCLTTCPNVTSSTVFTQDADYENYLCCLDFSYPYYTGGWSFMSQVTSGQINYINVFFSRDIVQAIAVCIICMFFMAHLIWLIERTQYGKSLLLTNPKEGFNKYYLNGLKDGVWFSTTTLMNGVVNSEKTIITPIGRLFSTTWVMFGILMSAFITADIAASLTTAQLTTSGIMTASDAAGKVVCTASGFFSSFFDTSFPGVGVQKVLVDNIESCFPMLTAGTVDAVFTIREEGVPYFQAGNGAGLMLSPTVMTQNYGLVWTEGWAFAAWVNEAMLLWQQNVVATQPAYTDATARWYYGDSHSITYGGNQGNSATAYNWPVLISAIVLVGMYLTLQGFVYGTHWWLRRQELKEAMEESSHNGGQSGKGSSVKGSIKSSKSFLVKAVSAIAAPPDELKVTEDGNANPSFHGASFHGGMSFSANRSRVVPHPSDNLGQESKDPDAKVHISDNGRAVSTFSEQPSMPPQFNLALADIMIKLEAIQRDMRAQKHATIAAPTPAVTAAHAHNAPSAPSKSTPTKRVIVAPMADDATLTRVSETEMASVPAESGKGQPYVSPFRVAAAFEEK